jgi:uncharacterized protein
MDPLAELVKIDPKSIGVASTSTMWIRKTEKQPRLGVELGVNSVGVNVNTASQHLLTYVSGLGPQLAQNIVEYRKENGAFPSREDLKKCSANGRQNL